MAIQQRNYTQSELDDMGVSDYCRGASAYQRYVGLGEYIDADIGCPSAERTALWVGLHDAHVTAWIYHISPCYTE